MFEIIFLGTSASAPSIHRGLSASIVLANEHRFLVDCGEGTQRQILKSGLGFRRLNRVLLTHGHLDHILGLGGLVSTFVRWEEGIDGLEIYGGRATLARVEQLIFGVVLGSQRPVIDINFVELSPGMVIHEDNNISVTAVPVVHRGPGCFGFIFEQKAHRPFQAEKAEAIGVPAGPLRGRLVRGETIMLDNGRTVHPEDVLADPIPGARLAYIGDTANTDNLAAHVQNANCLVIEATYLQEDAELAQAVGHLTAQQAAQLAHQANVETLILNHISRRNAEWAVRQEAQTVFPNAYVARDFDHFKITRDHPAERLPRDK